MSGSYEKINYSIRPAKCIERKMLCETFRKLHEFAPIENYRYIGFGSNFFSDFTLFHKNLGIKEMISIEKDVHNAERFKFNIPFNCIRVEFGESTEVLARLDWESKTIVWLDYDGQLTNGVLDDVKYVTSNVPSGCLIIVSCSAQLGALGERLSVVQENLGIKLPVGLKEEDLGGWKAAAIFRDLIDNEIQTTLTDRNGILNRGEQFSYLQLFNFNYADGAKMITVGGLIYQQKDEEITHRSGFENLHFIRNGRLPYKIEVPSLTYKEIRFLDTQLPCHDPETLNVPGTPKNQIKRYAEYYRFFPNFAETEL